MRGDKVAGIGCDKREGGDRVRNATSVVFLAAFVTVCGAAAPLGPVENSTAVSSDIWRYTKASGRYPAVASDGADWLAVFGDEGYSVRTAVVGFDGSVTASSLSEIVGDRLPNYYLVDRWIYGNNPNRSPCHRKIVSPRPLDVDFDGEQYLIVWQLYVPRPWETGAPIRRQWVYRSGKPIGSPRTMFRDERDMDPRIVWNGARHAFACTDIAGTNRLYFGLLSPDGFWVAVPRYVDSCPVWDLDHHAFFNPSISSAGSRFILGYLQARSEMVFPPGQLEPEQSCLIVEAEPLRLVDENLNTTRIDYNLETETRIAMASDGEGFVIIDEPNVVLFDGQGNVSETVEIAEMGLRDCTWNGSRYVLAWEDEGIRACTLTNTGEKGQIHTVSARAATDHGVRVVNASGQCLVVWIDPEDGAIYGSRIDEGARDLDPEDILISVKSESQLQPSAAWRGTTGLAVWREELEGHADRLMARPFDRYGAPLEGSAVTLRETDRDLLDPDVATDGNDYLACWQESTGSTKCILAGVIDGGNPATESICEISDNAMEPAVAFQGGNYLLVWTRTTPTRDIMAARVTTSGAVLDPAGIPIWAHDRTQDQPAIAAGETECLIAWRDQRETNGGIYAARVRGSDGTVLDPNGFAVATTTRHVKAPAVAYGLGRYLIAWENKRESSNKPDIFARFVSPNGTLLDEINVSGFRPGDDLEPTVSFDGERFAVIWRYETEGINPWDLAGAIVDIQGKTEVVMPLLERPDRQSSPHLIATRGNYILFFESDEPAPYGTDRVLSQALAGTTLVEGWRSIRR